MNNPYQSYIVSVLSNEALELAKGIKNTSKSFLGQDEYFHYPVSGVDLEGNPPSDEDVETIFVETATKELLKSGADLLYKDYDKGSFLFIEILGSLKYSTQYKEEIINNVSIDRLNNLSSQKNNEVFIDMLNNLNAKNYLTKFIDNGLEYKQSIYFNNEETIELIDLSKGYDSIFQLLNYNPYLLNLSHIYTYKDKYSDNPEENAMQTTLKDKLESILSYLKIMSNEEILDMYKVSNVNKFKDNINKIKEIFDPILQYKAMEEKLSEKKDSKNKKKI